MNLPVSSFRPWRAIPALTFAVSLAARAQVVEDLYTSNDLIRGQAQINGVALQPDGKILISQPSSNPAVRKLVRLFPDGTLDPTLDKPAEISSGSITDFIVQPDGKIVGGGSFLIDGAVPRTNLARYHPDGALDTGFDPGATDGYCGMALQPDGKIIVRMLDGNLRRIHPEGPLDSSFSVAVSGCFGLAMQADGKILLGTYTNATVNGTVRSGMARLNSNGTLDAGFNAAFRFGLETLAVQPDGRILVGGRIELTAGGTPRAIIRLNSNGSLDTSFNPPALRDFRADGTSLDGIVYGMCLQADGRIIINGSFNRAGGNPVIPLIRLNANGSIDPSFSIPVYDPLYGGRFVGDAAQEPNGDVIARGSWQVSLLRSTAPGSRIREIGEATESLSLEGQTLSWLRGGTAPEVWRTEFAFSTDGGGTWTALGNGSRKTGGWELSGVTVPDGASVRARGFNASPSKAWSFIDSGFGAPFLIGQPDDTTGGAGGTVKFFARAAGSGPLTYQWRKDGVALADGASIAGANSPVLVLSGLTGRDAGNYDLLVSNALGEVASETARLTITDPVIVAQPTDQWVYPGEAATFTVGVAGDSTFHYTWFRNGEEVPGVDSSSYSFIAGEADDGTVISARIENAFGSVNTVQVRLHVTRVVLDDFDPLVGGTTPEGDYLGHSLIGGIAIERDGDVLIEGIFTNYLGSLIFLGPDAVPRQGLARVHADGSPDLAFDINKPEGIPDPGPVHRIAVLPDDRILVALERTSGRGLDRILPDGRLDSSFVAPSLEDAIVNGTLVSHQIHAIVPLRDGKTYVAGYRWEDPWRGFIYRLNSNGSRDTTFNVGAFANGGISTPIYDLAVLPDDKVVIAGKFTAIGGIPIANFARLNTSGTVDQTFAPASSASSNGADPTIAILPNGGLLAGGVTFANGAKFARLTPDGALDASFAPAPSITRITNIVPQADGRILGLVQESFGSLRRLRQFMPDGSFAADFNPGQSTSIYGFAVQPDGGIVVYGTGGHSGDQIFRPQILNGKTRGSLARFHTAIPAINQLTLAGDVLRWHRGGSSPEVDRVTFESTPDGVNWSPLGNGQRITGGWELGGVSLPPNAVVRARGFLARSGFSAGSSWFMESVLVRNGGVKLSAPRMTAEGFAFDVSGGAGWQVGIESSPDLRTWTPVGSVSLGDSPATFTIPRVPGQPKQYFRGRFPQ